VEDLGLPVPIPDSTVCATAGIPVVLAMDEADCFCALSLTDFALAAPSHTACATRAPTLLMYFLPLPELPFISLSN
jgi:hypothetical protein